MPGVLSECRASVCQLLVAGRLDFHRALCSTDGFQMDRSQPMKMESKTSPVLSGEGPLPVCGPQAPAQTWDPPSRALLPGRGCWDPGRLGRSPGGSLGWCSCRCRGSAGRSPGAAQPGQHQERRPVSPECWVASARGRDYTGRGTGGGAAADAQDEPTRGLVPGTGRRGCSDCKCYMLGPALWRGG